MIVRHLPILRHRPKHGKWCDRTSRFSLEQTVMTGSLIRLQGSTC